MKDLHGRSIDYMRISITDHCNLRCVYCLPHGTPIATPQSPLTTEQLVQICRVAFSLGVTRFKITGGEPLLRPDCLVLFAQLKAIHPSVQITLTTNGTHLLDHLPALAQLGIHGINLSLDSPDRETYHKITGVDGLPTVLQAIEQTIAQNIPLKLNCVPLAHYNQHQLLDMVQFAVHSPIAVRFIEVMPMGQGAHHTPLPNADILHTLQTHYPDLAPDPTPRGNGPATYYTSSNLCGAVGFISAMSHHFCDQCNRIRLTSLGFLKPCLYSNQGVDLRPLFTTTPSDHTVRIALQSAILQKIPCHQFGQGQADAEQKPMSQIGG